MQPGGGVCVWGAGLGPMRASGERRRPQGTVLVGGGPGLESGRTYSRLSADGKLYDAYVSYSDSPEDRKFVNFILKPQLERRRGYKLFLDARDLLPRAGTTAPALFPPSPGPDPAHRPPMWPGTRPCGFSLGPGPAFLAPPPKPRPAPPPPMPSSRRALRRPAGELEPLPASHRGAVGRFPWPGLVQLQLSVGPVRGSGPGGSSTPLTASLPQGGPVPAAGAHTQTYLHHLRGPAAGPRAPRAAPAASAPPPGDPAALEARLRGAEGGAESGAGQVLWHGAQRRGLL